MKVFFDWFTTTRYLSAWIVVTFVDELFEHFASSGVLSAWQYVGIVLYTILAVVALRDIYEIFSKRRKFYKAIQAQNCAIIDLVMCDDEEEKKKIQIRIDALDKLIKRY